MYGLVQDENFYVNIRTRMYHKEIIYNDVIRESKTFLNNKLY